MYESLVKTCCNSANYICIGGMFQVRGEEVCHWIDKEKAGKRCVITGGKFCEFFSRYIIPATKGSLSLYTLSKYRKGLKK